MNNLKNSKNFLIGIVGSTAILSYYYNNYFLKDYIFGKDGMYFLKLLLQETEEIC
jgi:hypothetical protein